MNFLNSLLIGLAVWREERWAKMWDKGYGVGERTRGVGLDTRWIMHVSLSANPEPGKMRLRPLFEGWRVLPQETHLRVL